MSSRFERIVRISFFVGGIVAALSAAWWVPLIAIVLPSLRFRAWETLFLGLLSDLLWLPSAAFALPLPLFTLTALVVVWACEPLRSKLLLA